MHQSLFYLRACVSTNKRKHKAEKKGSKNALSIWKMDKYCFSSLNKTIVKLKQNLEHQG